MPKRNIGPPRGYKPVGEPVGYEPETRSRKAPSAYWCRFPYSQETLEKVQRSKRGK